MSIGIEFTIACIINLVSLGVAVGVFVSGQKRNSEKISDLKDDIARLETKQDKHNGIVEKVHNARQEAAMAMQSARSAHHRLNELKK